MPPSDHKVKLYYDFISQPSRALYIILTLGGKPFEACAIKLLEGEHMHDAYKSEINRFGKVPAIVDGQFKLAESIAILRYLTHKQYIPSTLYPSDLQLRARADEFLEWQHLAVRSSCSLYFRFVWVQTRLTGAPAPAGKVDKYKQEMERDLHLLETLWLQDGDFVTGDTLTVADIFGACEVEQLKTTGYNVRAKFPKVAQWIETVRAALAPHFDYVHQTVYRFERETQANVNSINVELVEKRKIVI